MLDERKENLTHWSWTEALRTKHVQQRRAHIHCVNKGINECLASMLTVSLECLLCLLQPDPCPNFGILLGFLLHQEPFCNHSAPTVWRLSLLWLVRPCHSQGCACSLLWSSAHLWHYFFLWRGYLSYSYTIQCFRLAWHQEHWWTLRFCKNLFFPSSYPSKLNWIYYGCLVSTIAC
jgi:hypothetical protein